MATRTRDLVVKVVSVLRVVATHSGVGLSELSRRADVPKSTALRVLNSLCEQAIIWLDSDKEYHLAMGAVALSPVGFDRALMDARVSQELERLAGLVGETTGFDVLVGDSVVVLLQATGPHLIGQVPRRMPISQPTWCTATGRLFLANLDDAELQANHKKAISEFAKNRPGRNLITELSEIRELGFSIVHGELAQGASALALPIEGGDRVVAALWTGGPTERFKCHDQESLVDTLRQSAICIGNILSAAWLDDASNRKGIPRS